MKHKIFKNVFTIRYGGYFMAIWILFLAFIFAVENPYKWNFSPLLIIIALSAMISFCHFLYARKFYRCKLIDNKLIVSTLFVKQEISITMVSSVKTTFKGQEGTVIEISFKAKTKVGHSIWTMIYNEMLFTNNNKVNTFLYLREKLSL